MQWISKLAQTMGKRLLTHSPKWMLRTLAATGDLKTKAASQTALTNLDTAIGTVSTERSKLGAVQNRLEHTVNNLGTTSENLQAAESRVRDVDMAKEMMELHEEQHSCSSCTSYACSS